jgi:hypothetical protein
LTNNKRSIDKIYVHRKRRPTVTETVALNFDPYQVKLRPKKKTTEETKIVRKQNAALRRNNFGARQQLWDEYVKMTGDSTITAEKNFTAYWTQGLQKIEDTM